MADDRDSKKRDGPSVILALTPDEFQQLRTLLASWARLEKMIVAHERAEWFWSSLGIWLKWIAAIGAALVAAKYLLSDFKDVLKGWVK